jgi:hypothetical protein
MGKIAQMVAQKLRDAPVDGYAAPTWIVYPLAPRKMMGLAGGESCKYVVANKPDPMYAMPGEGWAKIRGWKIHASQRYFVQEVYGFPAGVIHRLYDDEFYHVDKVADLN